MTGHAPAAGFRKCPPPRRFSVRTFLEGATWLLVGVLKIVLLIVLPVITIWVAILLFSRLGLESLLEMLEQR